MGKREEAFKFLNESVEHGMTPRRAQHLELDSDLKIAARAIPDSQPWWRGLKTRPQKHRIVDRASIGDDDREIAEANPRLAWSHPSTGKHLSSAKSTHLDQ